MAERYKRLFLLPENIYAEGSPVLIAAGALLKDNQSGKLLAQLKLRNISPKSLREVTVAITPQYPDGRAVEKSVLLSISGDEIPRDVDFGQKAPAFIPGADAYAYSAYVKRVDFADGTVWENAADNWMPLIPPQTLEGELGSEAAGNYRTIYGAQCMFAPIEQRGLWTCACGSLNMKEEPNCHSCGLEIASLLAASAAELAQQVETQNAEKAARKKKIIKLSAIGTVALVVAIVAGVLISNAVKKSNAYKEAVQLLEQGNYTLAEAAFTELGDYKDCATLLADIPYREAQVLLNNDRLDEAKAAFLALGDYKDSAAIAADIPYQQAVILLEGGKLDEARQAFTALGDYKDSAVYLEDIPYLEAHVLLNAGKLDEAREAFLALGKYKDSAEIAEDIPYQKAMRFMEQKAYQDALDLFATLGDYKDSQDQVVVATQALCDHTYTNEVAKEPNCTETGIRLYTCSKCSKTYEEDIPIRHEYTSSVTRQPTCSKVGEKTTVCKLCNDTVLTDVAMLPHTWKDATCTSKKTCTVCNKTEGSMLPHKYAAATCVKLATCVDCGATTGSYAAHDYAAATCETPRTCRVCSATTGSAAGHRWREATCSAPKTCSTCGATEGKKLRHDYYSGDDYMGICRACRAKDDDWKDGIDIEYSSEIVNGFQITSVRAKNPRASTYWLEYDIVVTVEKVAESDANSIRVRSSGRSLSLSYSNGRSMSVGDSITLTDDDYFYGERSYSLTLSAY